MDLFKFKNAHNPDLNEKKEMFKLAELYKHSCWIPESVIVFGDSYIFYDDAEDLKNNWYSIYDYIIKFGDNKGHWFLAHKLKEMNYVEVTNKYYEYKDRNLDEYAELIFDYVKYHWPLQIEEEED